MLRLRAHEVAVALRAAGHGRGARVAIIGSMTPEAVAAYLAVVLVGGAVVSVADSFSPEEMAVRLRVAAATLVIVQVRGGCGVRPLLGICMDQGCCCMTTLLVVFTFAHRLGGRIWFLLFRGRNDSSRWRLPCSLRPWRMHFEYHRRSVTRALPQRQSLLGAALLARLHARTSAAEQGIPLRGRYQPGGSLSARHEAGVPVQSP